MTTPLNPQQQHPYPPGQLPPMSAPPAYPNVPLPPPEKLSKPKRFGWLAAGLFALGGLTLGVLADDNSVPVTPAAITQPAPTVTVTEAAEPEEKTPQSCLDALDYADRGFGIAAKVIGYVGAAIEAVIDMDAARVERIADKVNTQSEKMGDLGPKYVAAKEECRANA